MVAAGDDPRPHALGDEGEEDEGADRGLDLDQAALPDPQTLGVSGVDPEGVPVAEAEGLSPLPR